MPTGAIADLRGTPRIVKVCCRFDVGASGAMTLKYGRGIATVAETSTGKYTITFTEAWPVLMDLRVNFANATTVENYNSHEVVDTYSYSAKTVNFEVNDIDETAALIEPANGSDCYIEATFLETV